jgi:hypothetical protein
MAKSNHPIDIKPSHRGRLTAVEKRTGETAQQLTHSKNPTVRKEAQFAVNAKSFHHGKKK